MDEVLKNLEGFHGHLGPYLVIGYRMGKIANDILSKDPFSKDVIVDTGTKPPMSCIIDGIQFSSGCTLGKGNISVKNKGIAKAHFAYNGKNVRIVLKPNIQKDIDTNVIKENMISYSKKIYRIPDEELFDIDSD
jgi:formylmethanofuran dehydrogenase subunit E